VRRKAEPLHVHLYEEDLTASLVRFALTSHIERHGRQHTPGEILHLSPATMSRLVRGPSNAAASGPMSAAELRHLADVQDVVTDADHHFASLVAFHGRLFPVERSSDIVVPARWADDLLEHPPRSFVEVLLFGEAALALTERGPRSNPVLSLDSILDRLLVLGGLPSVFGIEALQLIARFADSPATRTIVFERVRKALHESPIGFRAWRAVTLIVRRHVARSDPEALGEIHRRTRELFADLPVNAHPSRSLDIEVAAATPNDWAWANDVLRGESENPETTPRRLASAGLMLWKRTGDGRALRASIKRARAGADASPHLDWIYRHLVSVRGGNDVALLPDGPPRPLVHSVAKQTYAEGEVSDRIRGAAQELFEHGVLSNHGLARRHAWDALRTSSLAVATCAGLHSLVHSADVDQFLAERACFAIGFMRVAPRSAEVTLQRVLDMRQDNEDSLGAIEAAAWSVGELWASDDGSAIPRWAVAALTRLLDDGLPDSPAGHRISCAAAYSLSVAAPVAAKEVLERTSRSATDSMTRRMAKLGADRSAPDRVVPLVDLHLSVPDPLDRQ
jgi:hypothetical protein